MSDEKLEFELPPVPTGILAPEERKDGDRKVSDQNSLPSEIPQPSDIPQPPVSAPSSQPAPSVAAIDPLLQYRGSPDEVDYYQQESYQQESYQQESQVSPRRHRAGRSAARFWIQLAAVVGVIVLAVVLLRVLVFESFYITSDSMVPTLDSGDRIIVNKISSGSAGRGDIVVFNRPVTDPTESDDDLVKRVVALEGETIAFSQGRVFIGELLLLEPYLSEGMTTEVPTGNRLFDACVNQTSADSCTVAPGHVYVLGDSRDFSFDSRFFGPIPKGSIVGRAFWRVWPIGDFGGV